MILYSLLFLTICSGEDIYHYLGTWQGTMMNFTESSGRSYLITYEGSNSEKFYELVIFDGNWESRPYSLIEGNFSGSTISFLGLDSVQITTPDSTYLNCEIEGELSSDSSVSGLLASSNCGISLDLSLSEYTLAMFYTGKLIYLGFFISLKITEFIALKRIIFSCNSATVARSVHPLTFVFSASVDVFYWLWWVYLASAGYVIPIQISYLVLILVVFVPLMLIREKQKLYNKIIEFQGDAPRRNRFCTYMSIAMIYVILLRSLYYFNVVAANLIMAPQIVKNLHSTSIPRGLIVILIVVQLGLTLYVTLFPYNFLIWEPDVALSLAVIFVCGVQVGVLMWSKPRIGEEIEAPLVRRNEVNPETVARIVEHATECGICLERLESIDIVVTRCQHAFHHGCLQRWIDMQPVCPICRQNIQELVI